ncbi:MAG: hypothetical protein N5P05_004162 (plasmid) [Chroococcopsis gigantea SAG 12.99]|jgi:hypothetical protein|nr:hypothetical protein [Chroococcopsis gigantea SAG 12.99]
MKSHKSLSETFFILTPDVREKLLTASLTAAEWRIWCYLVSLDPFGDRGAKYLPAELMLKCNVKKSTYFAAKAKFQKLGFFDFKDGATKVFNLQGHQTHSRATEDSQQNKIIESNISEPRFEVLESNSNISEPLFEVLESNSNISENRPPELLPVKASGSPQTIHTYTNLQTNHLQEEEGEKEERGELLNLASGLSSFSITPSKDSKEVRSLSITPSKNRQEVSTSITPSKINPDIADRLRSLSIPMNKKVMEAIEKKTEREVLEVIEHIEEADDIKSPIAVFLYRMNKLTVTEIVEKKLSPEFLEWYQYARGEQVEDQEPEHLPRDRYGEPLVRLRGDDYNRLIEWRRVKGNEDFTVCQGEALQNILGKFRQKLQEVKNGRQLQ